MPIHRIHRQSDLVTDSVVVGVRPSLPVKGVSFILGNDLARGKQYTLLSLRPMSCFRNTRVHFLHALFHVPNLRE